MLTSRDAEAQLAENLMFSQYRIGEGFHLNSVNETRVEDNNDTR